MLLACHYSPSTIIDAYHHHRLVYHCLLLAYHYLLLAYYYLLLAYHYVLLAYHYLLLSYHHRLLAKYFRICHSCTYRMIQIYLRFALFKIILLFAALLHKNEFK